MRSVRVRHRRWRAAPLARAHVPTPRRPHARAQADSTRCAAPATCGFPVATSGPHSVRAAAMSPAARQARARASAAASGLRRRFVRHRQEHSAARSRSAVRYARSRLRVCAGMSVSTEFGSASAMRLRTRLHERRIPRQSHGDVNVLHACRRNRLRHAEVGQDRIRCALCMTPANQRYDGHAMSIASSVPLTPP